METKKPEINKEFGVRHVLGFGFKRSMRTPQSPLGVKFLICEFSGNDCFVETYHITKDAINTTCIHLN